MKDQLLKVKETFQPTCVFVGSLTNIESFYVVVDERKFKFQSCLEALDFAFKLFFAVESSYPVRSETVWTFIQRAVYDIKLTTDFIGTDTKALIGYIENKSKPADSG